MATRAQTLYDQGRTAREVLAECYGVSLPDEIFVIADADIEARKPALYLTNQPWLLIVIPGQGPVPARPSGPDKYEQAVVDLDPDLLPLVRLIDEDAKHGDSMLCYRLSALADGATTVYGIEGAVWGAPESLPDEVLRYGDSLLDVLAEYFADYYAQVEERFYGPGNAWPREMLDQARVFVDLADRLKRDLIFGLGKKAGRVLPPPTIPGPETRPDLRPRAYPADHVAVTVHYVRVIGRGELTDRAWAAIEPLLPEPGVRAGRWRDHRQVINGILWKLRTGAPWRDLPKRYGPWKSCHERLRRWSADGTWDRILSAAQAYDDGHTVEWTTSVDSSVVRAHQHSTGARSKGAPWRWRRQTVRRWVAPRTD